MTGVKSFKKLELENKELNKLQSNIELTFTPIINSEIINGILIRNLNLTTGQDNIVAHKLGRKALGYIIVKKSDESTIWDVDSETFSEKNFLILNCSADVVVSLWVF